MINNNSQDLISALNRALDINNNLKEYIINSIIDNNKFYIESYDLKDLLNENSYPLNHCYKTIKELDIDIDRFKLAVEEKFKEFKNKPF